MSKKLKIQITATQRVEYNQEVEMTLEEFQRLDQMLDNAKGFSEKSKVSQEIEMQLDLRDVFDSDDLEIEEFYVVEDAA